MYSAPGRLVHRFLHARLHVWHPMHLSRWNTIETCERTFMSGSLCGSPFRFSRQFANDRIRVPVGGRGAIIVEVVTMLGITANHQYRLQAQTRHAVGATAAPIPAHRRFWER